MATSQQAATHATRVLARRRWRVSAALTLAIVCVYFGFIVLVAYRPDWLAIRLQDGLSLGIVLGAAVIVAAWLLTYVYVWWANRIYDPALAALRAQHAAVTESDVSETSAAGENDS